MATNAAHTQHDHPPLARDANDNYVAIPDGTCAWRICRKTDGRPREIFAPDKQPMRFPLDTTLEDLADTCGPDTYRVYALDEVGKTLGPCVVTVTAPREARDLRNAAAQESSSLLSIPRATSVSSPPSDLRFALEAMTQMMRINGEALRAVAESQADWVKSIASVKGYFRNAAPPPQPVSVSTSRDDEDDDADDDDEDPEPPPKGLYDVLTPFAEHLAPQVGPLVAMFAGGGNVSRSRPALAPTSEANDSALASKPSWELRDFVDFKYAGDKARAKKVAREANDSTSPRAKPSLQARVMRDPQLLAQFMTIKSLLGPDELHGLLALADQSTEAQQEHLVAQIAPLAPAEAAALLREMLAELRADDTPA